MLTARLISVEDTQVPVPHQMMEAGIKRVDRVTPDIRLIANKVYIIH